MLKKFWYWLFGAPAIDPVVELIHSLISNQERQTTSLFDAVAKIGQASEKQAEVLNSYLKLFQQPGEPQRWELDESEDNKRELLESGFPVSGTDSEQAEYILKHIGDF